MSDPIQTTPTQDIHLNLLMLRVQRCEMALQEIAQQLTSDELEKAHGDEGAPDYAGGWDAMIIVARSALA